MARTGSKPAKPKPAAGRAPQYGKTPPLTASQRAELAAADLAVQKPKTLIERLKAWWINL